LHNLNIVSFSALVTEEKMSYQGYQDRMFELKVKVANAESLLAVAEKLSDKSGMIACRQKSLTVDGSSY